MGEDSTHGVEGGGGKSTARTLLQAFGFPVSGSLFPVSDLTKCFKGEDFQFKNSLAMKFTSQHELHQ